MIRIFLISLTMISSVVMSEEVKLKLSCNITITTEYPSGRVEKNRVKELFEIDDYGTDKFIIPLSDQFSSISTIKRDNVLFISDISDSNKWDIKKTIKGSKVGSTITTSYIIDRNSGMIWYSSEIDNTKGILKEIGLGECEKINTEKKKF